MAAQAKTTCSRHCNRRYLKSGKVNKTNPCPTTTGEACRGIKPPVVSLLLFKHGTEDGSPSEQR